MDAWRVTTSPAGFHASPRLTMSAIASNNRLPHRQGAPPHLSMPSPNNRPDKVETLAPLHPSTLAPPALIP